MRANDARSPRASPAPHHELLSPLDDAENPSADQVVVRVHSIQAFAGIALMACVVVVLVVTFSFSNGVSLSTLDITGLSNSAIDKKLDWYNARVGNVTSLIEGGFAVAVKMIMPVAIMCLSTKETLVGRRALGASSAAFFACSFGVTYLLKNAFSSVNVRQEPTSPICLLGPTDLREDLSNITRPNNYLRWSASTKTPQGNPSIKTLLRSALWPTQHEYNVTCAVDGDLTIASQVDQYFIQRQWMSDMLSVAPDTKVSGVITTQGVNGGTPSAAPPMGFAAAQDLLDVGLVQLQVLFTAASKSSTHVSSASTFYDDAANALREALDIPEFDNFAPDDATLQFSRTALGHGFGFDAVTFEIPTTSSFFPGNVPKLNRQIPRIPLGLLHPVNYTQCGWDGCLLPIELHSRVKSIPAQVHGFALCDASSERKQLPYSANLSGSVDPMTFEKNCMASNTSMLVVSVAKQLQANGIFPVVAGFGVHNPRNTYKVSVGVLSWNLSDLATTFGGTCVDAQHRPKPNGCTGVYFELDRTNSSSRRFVVLGKDELGLASRHSFNMLQDMNGRRLVNGPLIMARTQGTSDSGVLLDDYLLMENVGDSDSFFAASISDEKNENGREKCSKTAERSIERVRRNHFYAEEPLQQAYTAAMFWLFQNATLRSALDQESISTASMPQLEFDASVRRVSLKASVPRESAIMTLLGMAILVLLTLVVVVMGKKRAPEIQTKLTPALLTEAILKTGQFPERVVDITVTWNKEHVGLSDYKVKSLVLEAKDGQKVVIDHHGHIHSVNEQSKDRLTSA